MKKISVLLTVICLLLTGCANSQDNPSVDTAPIDNETAIAAANDSTPNTEQTAGFKTFYPLPDTTMENLSDAILSISLEEGSVYVDDTAKILMDIKIFSYDKYDMVDVSMLKAGDTLVTHSGEVKLESLERNSDGSISVNGGLDVGGFDLITDDCGCFYERGYNDAKNWYEVGVATIGVATDFEFLDNSNLDQGEILYYPGSFLDGAVPDYYFTPHNTTIRVENGQIIEMHRRYVP